MTKDSFTILAIGDIIGRPGRDCLYKLQDHIKTTWNPDIIIANGENAAGGFGITEKVFQQLTTECGVDVITTGNHWMDKKEIFHFGPKYPQLLLPANMYNVKELRRGYCLKNSPSGRSYAVINLTGRVFMKGENDCPFKTVDQILAQIPSHIKTIVVDFHAEVSSEKQAIGHYLAGRASLVYGTHTHCPTADERILNEHTGYVTDLGMTGVYDSVLGMRKEQSLSFFLTGQRVRFEPAEGDPWLCGVVAKIAPLTGRCVSLERIRVPLSSAAL